MGKYFGTDGFRGEANVNLTADHAFRVGRFLGWYYCQKNQSPARIVIGKDTRRSSYMFEYALAAGITASGGDGYLLHVTTTPSVAYVTRTEDFDCGVMISASHNPFFDNGIKLLNSQGEKMEESVIDRLEAYLDGETEIPFATGSGIGRTVDYVEGRNRYVGYLISLGRFSFKGVKVALDCANGAAWTIARSVFEALGARTYVIGAEPDGLNINRACGSTHMEALQKFVVENGLDVGFAYDGDADRCLCVDEKGQIVTGDHILYMLGLYMKRREQLDNNTVVATVMSNLGLFKALEREEIGYAATQVGDKYVYAYMAEHGCRLGGEQSGHIIISQYASTGDGILTSLKIMEVMLASQKPLSQLAAGLTLYPQALENVPVADKKTALEAPEVKGAILKAEKLLGDRGRLLVRESGTEPVIRVMAEAEEEALCRKAVETVVTVLR